MITARAAILTVVISATLVSCAADPFRGKGQSHSGHKHNISAVERHIQDRSDPYFYFTMGLLAERGANYEKAIKSYKMAVDMDPALLQAYSRSAHLLLRLGKINEAKKMANAALSMEPDFIEALNVAAGVYYSLGNDSKAIELYGKLAELDPEAKDIKLFLALSQYKAGQRGKALAGLNHYIKEFPKDALGLHYKGRIYIQEKKFGKAIGVYEKLFKARSDFSPALFSLGWLYEIEGKYEKAMKLYDKLLSHNPQNIVVLKRVARVKKNRATNDDDQQKARVKLTGMVPGDLDIFMRFALTHWRLAEMTGSPENFNHSLDYFQLYRAANPDNRQALYYIANIFERLGLLDWAVEAWKDLGEFDTTKTRDVHLKIAEILERAGKTKEGLKHAIKASELDPKEPELHYFSGLLFNKVKDSSKAEQSFLKAIELKPTDEKYYFYLGVVYEKLGRYDKCIDAMKKAIDIKPDHANALNYLGYIYAEQNINLNKAEKHLLEALSLEPENGYFIDSLGWIYYKQKRYEKALEWILMAIRNIPPDPTVLEHLGDVYKSLDKPSAAAKAYERSLNAIVLDGRKLDRKATRAKLNELKKHPSQKK